MGRITDDTRIRASLPTIRYLREHGAEVIVCSHLGRPKGAPRPGLSLRPVAERLSELLGEPVAFNGDEGPVRLLENLRFDPREETNDPALAAELAGLADLFVNDAFGTVHRAHASTEGVAHLLPSAAGLLLAGELEAFARILESPEHPFVVVIGGAKVADPVGVVDRFTGLADAVLVGGAMAFTFLAAGGTAVGASRHEDAEGQEVARRAMSDAGERGCELVLPDDVVIAERVAADAPTRVVAADAIPDGWMGLDIGSETSAAYARRLAAARTIFWNGPMGVFEFSVRGRDARRSRTPRRPGWRVDRAGRGEPARVRRRRLGADVEAHPPVGDRVGRDDPRRRVCRDPLGDHHVVREHKLAAALAGIGHRPPGHLLPLGVLVPGCPDGGAARREERERHGAADEHGIGEAREAVNDADLVGHLRPADHHDEGVLGSSRGCGRTPRARRPGAARPRSAGDAPHPPSTHVRGARCRRRR